MINKRISFKLVLVVVFISLFAAAYLIQVPTLIIEDQNENNLFVPLYKVNTFTLNYVHSVQKTPVQEHFVLAPDLHLQLYSTEYRSLGVGLPFLPDEGKFENKNGVFILRGLHRDFDSIHIAMMPLAKHSLTVEHQQYDLADYFPPGSLITIHAQKENFIQISWQVMTAKRR